MIAYIKGELVYIGIDTIVVETGGIGYEIRVPLTVMEELPETGEEVRIHTYLYVREDAINLYGFTSKDDLDVFKLLITVNGIGPKGALGILGAISPDTLRFAVLSDDVKTISKAPGIGTKTAGKLIIELKDKLKLEDAFEQRLAKTVESPAADNSAKGDLKRIRNEAIQALVALGYSSTDAMKAVRQVELSEGMDVETVLKQSLKQMSFF